MRTRCTVGLIALGLCAACRRAPEAPIGAPAPSSVVPPLVAPMCPEPSSVVAEAPDASAYTPPPRGPARIALGEAFSCVLRLDGSVACWGRNESGELGDGTATAERRVPAPVPGLPQVVDLAAARRHACAVAADGAVWCWGDNGFGCVRGLPDSFGVTRAAVAVAGVGRAVQVALGEYSSCARIAGGTVRCWGRNAHGELGDSSPSVSSGPVTVPGVSGVVDLAAFGFITCAVVAGGHVTCWGHGADRVEHWGGSGEVPAPPVKPEEMLPRPVEGIERVTRLYMGPHHTCGLRDDGALWCWGDNQCNQVQPCGTHQGRPLPTRTYAPARGSALGAGSTCVVRPDGAVECWGCPDAGVGDGTRDHRAPPRVVPGVRAVEMASGRDHICAAADNGRVWCWGGNHAGQLGTGSARAREDAPALVRW